MGGTRWVMVVLIAMGAAGCGSTPTVPDEGAWPLVARTVLQGPMTPDATEGVDPETLPRSPAGVDCVPVNRPAGPWTLCWNAYRDPHDSDPTQDYYRFNIGGSFGGESGTGVRWAALRVRLVGDASSNVFLNWPSGEFDGPCEQVEVSLGIGPVQHETICGRTTAGAGREPWSYRVMWTCVECLRPDHADRPLPLQQWVAVPQGKIPSWEIFADLGS